MRRSIRFVLLRSSALLAFAPIGVAQAQVVASAETFADIDQGTIIVTGARSAEVAGTKLDAPIRDLPVSIQVIPREIIDAQDFYRPHDIIQNVSGVFRGNTVFGDSFIFRGFATSDFLRNGIPDRRGSIRDTANVEQIEVLKGPASVLFGRIEPGGTLNYVLKRPLEEMSFGADLKVDTYGLTRGTLDISAVSNNGDIGFRVNLAGEHGGNFRDFSFSDRAFASGSFVWKISDRTKFTIDLETLYDKRLLDRGVPSISGVAGFDNGPVPIPVSRLISEPTDYRQQDEKLAGYAFEHKFSSAWRMKQTLLYYTSSDDEVRTRFRTFVVPFTGLINRDALLVNRSTTQLSAQLEVIGDFTFLGNLRHQVVVGVDIDRAGDKNDNRQSTANLASNRINIYNPVYGLFQPIGLRQNSLTDASVDADAVYAQDLIEFGDHIKLLVGARYDRARSSNINLMTSARTAAKTSAISPRAGLVWQPNDVWSLYASYSESFVPVIGQDFSGRLFDPTLGKQYEAGIKADWFNGKLTASLAAFQIKKSNISVPDPVNAGFNIQGGVVTSEGVEFDISGNPMAGLLLVANFSLIDARYTSDTRGNVLGNRPANVPSKGGSFFAKYTIQHGSLEGWGISAGGRYVGRRAGDDTATFFLPGYVTADASLSYETEDWKLSVKLENLFDKIYYISAHPTLGIYPGTPRSARFSASYRF